ncbi:hypothetical protein CROQUDRAFT_515219 [Cronartium quercuum f. sp. fusiforme G11]|uniref:Uncharacterized protein n=1 Tax=Cronartium quercuum f. sp. fusiforme G11 TaxID=708437 RepID=A0A9P6NIG7_9BASI|nr:hypothetical protein CROQUDRAFT_515219 [Cronartium quercuum f. sp. fusiforme G11]
MYYYFLFIFWEDCLFFGLFLGYIIFLIICCSIKKTRYKKKKKKKGKKKKKKVSFCGNVYVPHVGRIFCGLGDYRFN